MPTPTPQQREYYVPSLPVDTPETPIALWGGKIAILQNGDEYWCNGFLWQPFGTNSSTVGSLDAASPISGNPAALDTPAEIAATLQAQAAEIAALQAFQGAIDQNDNDIADTTDNLENQATNFVQLFKTGLTP